MIADLRLREVVDEDLPILFEHQLDAEAIRLAAFARRDRSAFITHWRGLLADSSIIKKTIVVDGRVAGNIVCFGHGDEREVGYWIGKEYWGRGIATHALAEFLLQVKERPLYASVAKHNLASIRVLEKCGFKSAGQDKAFAVVDGNPIEGITLRLDQ